jgi:WD40 repeat protein
MTRPKRTSIEICLVIIALSSPARGEGLDGSGIFIQGRDSPKASTVAFSPDGKYLASGYEDGSVRVWDLSSATLKFRASDSQGFVCSIAFSPDGKFLAEAHNDSRVILRDSGSGDILRDSGHYDVLPRMISTAFSHDGTRLAFGGTRAAIWYLKEQGKDRVLEKTDEEVNRIAFSADDATIIGAKEGGILGRWNGVSGALKKNFSGKNRGMLNSVVFNPSGRILATGGELGIVNLWDFQAQAIIGTNTLNGSEIQSIAFSPDGKRFATAAADGIIGIWNTPGCLLQYTIKEEYSVGGSVAVAYSPDGKTLASAGEDGEGGAIHLWSHPQGELVAKFVATSPSDFVAYTPDGYFSASPRAFSHIWYRVDDKVHGFFEYRSYFHKPQLVADKIKDSGKIPSKLSAATTHTFVFKGSNTQITNPIVDYSAFILAFSVWIAVAAGRSQRNWFGWMVYAGLVSLIIYAVSANVSGFFLAAAPGNMALVEFLLIRTINLAPPIILSFIAGIVIVSALKKYPLKRGTSNP